MERLAEHEAGAICLGVGAQLAGVLPCDRPTTSIPLSVLAGAPRKLICVSWGARHRSRGAGRPRRPSHAARQSGSGERARTSPPSARSSDLLRGDPLPAKASAAPDNARIAAIAISRKRGLFGRRRLRSAGMLMKGSIAETKWLFGLLLRRQSSGRVLQSVARGLCKCSQPRALEGYVGGDLEIPLQPTRREPATVEDGVQPFL